MKNKSFLIWCAAGFFSLAGLSFAKSAATCRGGDPLLRAEEPWSPEQLLSPAVLARTMGDPQAKQPIVFCIGPGAVIKGSIDIGPTRDSSNVNKLRRRLDKLPRDAAVVIYCGCCPFVHCPNIRPAFTLLTELKFTHPLLLNLEHNIRVDWIDKGYPVAK